MPTESQETQVSGQIVEQGQAHNSLHLNSPALVGGHEAHHAAVAVHAHVPEQIVLRVAPCLGHRLICGLLAYKTPDRTNNDSRDVVGSVQEL